jgi:hypothetical protein
VGATNKISIAWQAAIKKAVLADPQMSASVFFKKNPHIKTSPFTYFRYKKAILTHAGREGEMRKYDTSSVKKNKTKTYQLCWKFPTKDFIKDPIVGLNGFLEALSASGRANFELVKVDLLSEGAWKPYLEVRES